MTSDGMKFISDAMASAGIPYEFMEYTSSINDVSSYWVGEYSEAESITEDGLQETQFILTGPARRHGLNLKSKKIKSKNYFLRQRAGQQFLAMVQGLLFFMEMHSRFQPAMGF